MLSTKGWRVKLRPGASKRIEVRIRILRTAAYDSRKPARVTATWTGDGARTDTVRAVVEVIR
jgi:hypothetical protein